MKNFLQDLAWEEAWKLAERCKENPKQVKQMGFQNLEQALLFEFKRIYGLK